MVSLWLERINSIKLTLNKQRHRAAFLLKDEPEWQSKLVDVLILNSNSPVQIGGVKGALFHAPLKHVSSYQAGSLLGQEFDLILYDCSADFDANAFCSVIGTLVAGGFCLFFNLSAPNNLAEQWLNRALEKLPLLSNVFSSSVFSVNLFPPPLPAPNTNGTEKNKNQLNQIDAVTLIKKTLEGRANRPLILTARRGRGKTTALALAAIELMDIRPVSIVLTAPQYSCVAIFFERIKSKEWVKAVSKHHLIYKNSEIKFVPLDLLDDGTVEANFLMIDEASAIPLPQLKKLLKSYPRVVCSTTTQGYEGIGKSFTLKFIPWLEREFKTIRFAHLIEPIRWGLNDPIEHWTEQAFLLKAASESFDFSHQPHFFELSQFELYSSPALMHDVFTLLSTSHYQTSPNDLFQILKDERIRVFCYQSNGRLLGCILAIEEGLLSDEDIEAIAFGKIRPKGQLAVSTLINHLSIKHLGKGSSLRIMRIAVEEKSQQQSVGSEMLSQLKKIAGYEFFSVSFGATESLLRFWQKNGFVPVFMGSKKDQASGSYSLLMIFGDNAWLSGAYDLFLMKLKYTLSDPFYHFDLALLRGLLGHDNRIRVPLLSSELTLIKDYFSGGSNYENMSPLLERFIHTIRCSELTKVSDVVLEKIILKKGWQQCALKFKLAGRAAIEREIKKSLSQFTV